MVAVAVVSYHNDTVATVDDDYEDVIVAALWAGVDAVNVGVALFLSADPDSFNNQYLCSFRSRLRSCLTTESSL